ncbi:uncharacterized protein TrAFT101_007825 [Trichoderma asperellum]|uniref:DUF7730 domain-containing protein n=1 Tax=Trichoderma asperellum (strain ATCC 204424 / CBS 433.97 / NBRC 101777) TaxID=1042311 RepID=A0A2T3Z3I6_TRIA4|nr:hypothetical protein M441DRAFT_59436 [Trichoderma asperellum CBS 433.97]PTB39381.1 hypothetical protein M441DRAFT_59436 [Trichoderma asperellum CBS 433.97]UKZ92892.1 hypothetical protein TrAFT101_007825 [Trichoderma asperellum]
MPNAIISWFRRRRVARSSRRQRALSASSAIVKEALPAPPHPKLPSQRRARLTPTPSCDDFVSAANAATANSFFFTKLPLEIRRKILIEAFGGRTVHMDLVYDHPLLPPEEGAFILEDGTWRRPPHGNMNLRFQGGSCDVQNLRLDDSRPKEWAWRSSVCHRNIPGCPPTLRNQPAEDYCRFGQTEWQRVCLTWPGEFPTKCLIGAMGWLRSCRQAYVEGIDILYSTNTFHTASKEMILSLKSILLPQRLSSITSVELLWDFAPFPSIHPQVVKPPLSDMASFHAFLNAIPTTFPAIKRLHISLQGRLYPTKTVDGRTTWDNNIDRTDEILHPVDNFVLELAPNVQDFSLGIPSSLYIHQRDRALKNKDPVEQAHLKQNERHWRPLKGSAERSGYWVWLGQKDFTMPVICTMGEGGGLRDFVGEENWVLYKF